MLKKVGFVLSFSLVLYSASTDKDFTLLDGKGVILNEPTNTFSTKIKSNDNLNTNIVLTLPDNTPQDNQILVVDATGELSWADNNASVGSDNQKIDKFILEGNSIKLSLESDSEADKVIDLSSVTAFLKSTDIKDNLTSTDTNKPLSAKQGKTLKDLVDALNSSLSSHTSDTTNPHNVTKTQVGLSNVDNTSDTDKPISTLTQNALDDLNSTLTQKIDDVNTTQSDNQGVDILDFNGTHLTISLDNSDINSTIKLIRTLSSIEDINITGVTNGQVLKYDSNSSSWIPYTLPSGITVVNNLTSTDATQVLSANQGRVLDEKIFALDSKSDDINQTVTTNLANFTTDISDINNSLNLQTSRVDEVNSSVTILSSNQTTLDNKITDVNRSITDNTLAITDVNSTLNSKIDDINSSIIIQDENNNILYGSNALSSNTSGSSNMALGIDSLKSNTHGNYNLAQGRSSLRSNTGGDKNIAQGQSTLYTNTTGNSNIALGNDALYHNSTGSNNIAQGEESLWANQTGSNNVALGVQAGHLTKAGGNNLGNTNNLFLGYSTKPLASGDSNEIVIGAEADGIGSNSVVLGNDSITKTALKGSVGIGTTSPSAKLDVNGTIKATAIDMQNNKITNLATPTDDNDSSNKAYVDASVAGAGGGYPTQISAEQSTVTHRNAVQGCYDMTPQGTWRLPTVDELINLAPRAENIDDTYLWTATHYGGDYSDWVIARLDYSLWVNDSYDHSRAYRCIK